MPSEDQTLIVDEFCNVEQNPLAFGKRYGQETLKLTPQHLQALQQGKLIAVDVQNEYVLFIELDKECHER